MAQVNIKYACSCIFHQINLLPLVWRHRQVPKHKMSVCTDHTSTSKPPEDQAWFGVVQGPNDRQTWALDACTHLHWATKNPYRNWALTDNTNSQYECNYTPAHTYLYSYTCTYACMSININHMEANSISTINSTQIIMAIPLQNILTAYDHYNPGKLKVFVSAKGRLQGEKTSLSTCSFE